MSHTVEWIEPIFDRTYADIDEAEANRDLENPKGCYNYIDLNRIENNTLYVMEEMLDRKIIRVPPSMSVKTNWTEKDIPTREHMTRLIGNVIRLMTLSNPVIEEDLINISTATQISYILANAIEKNLQTMKDQPDLPIKKWLLRVENGIIEEYDKSAEYIAEDEIVHIRAVPYGESAQWMVFQRWSGDPNDLQYIDNAEQQRTTFRMVYHDDESYEVDLTANFMIRIPRTLTIHSGYISVSGEVVDSGISTAQYYAGDEILIIANRASSGKAFYEWTGTEEALDNLTGGPEPSTSWLTMPDCDVDLTPHYINAGKHSVTVDGTLQGWYDYNEYVSIYPSSRSEKWSFASWSGDTGYLEDVASSSFKMPDVNVRFTSNWTYNYSYNDITMVKGTIDGESKLEGAKESSQHTITAPQPPEGYVFGRWTREGLGSFGNAENSTTTFTVGDGNAVIDCTFVPAHTVTIENEGNNGGSRTIQVGEGKKYSISSSEVLADYMFQQWNKNGSKYSSSYYVNNITMGNEDVTYTAVYRDRISYDLTVNNGSGSGTYKERQSVSIKADTAPIGQEFSSWSGNYYSIGNRYNSSTSITMPSSNCTVTANYQNIPGEKVYHDLTVNNGSGTGRYYEGQRVTIRGNQAPDTYEFDYWTKGDSPDVVSYYQDYSFNMGTEDVEYTAHYKPIPYFNVTVINGKLEDGQTTGRFLRNSNPRIIMDPAPEGMQFLQWEVIEGDKENGVTEPLSENTTIRNLLADTTVKATYYVPDPEIKYTLTIVGKEGDISEYNYSVGEQVDITADYPDEGYEFNKWIGDVQYVNDRYAEKAVVNMPPKNIRLEMSYRQIGSEATYKVELENGELYDTSGGEGTEHWDVSGEFTEGSIIQIRATNIPMGWKFARWKRLKEEDDKSETTVADLNKEETTVRVEDFDIELGAETVERDKYKMTITDGEVSGSYYDTQPVTIFFSLESTEQIHYNFIRWSGDDIAYLKLVSGKSFDIFESGTEYEPGDKAQVVSMPARHITIKALYDTSYKVTIANGTIISEQKEFYSEGDTIKITANEPKENEKFSHWVAIGNVGDINLRNPNITITMPNGPISLTAVYVQKSTQNDIATSMQSLYDETSVSIDTLSLVSGQLEVGCLIIDVKGHHYVINELTEDTAKIFRLTKKQGGTSNG